MPNILQNTEQQLSPMKSKVRDIFLFVGLIYLLVISFSEFFHNHPIDGRAHSHCPACAVQLIINVDSVPEVEDFSAWLSRIEYLSVFSEDCFYIQEPTKLNLARAPPLLAA